MIRIIRCVSRRGASLVINNRLKSIATKMSSTTSNTTLALMNPKESAQFIMKHAKDVSIEDGGIELTANKVYESLLSGRLNPANFGQWELHPQVADENAIDWLFLADTLNFSFWSGDSSRNVPKWEVEYKGKLHTGYFALCAGINRALDEGLDILNPTVFGSFTEADILRVFRSATTTPIPMVEDRVKNLREASRVLLEKYNGSFVNCVKGAGQSAERLLSMIVADFGSYRDGAEFEGRQVTFWKRAQILIGDIWACFRGEGLGTFHDIDVLTMFADYRIPQVLLHFGALRYSAPLQALLESNAFLQNGDRLEVEIRGGSILAVEMITERVRERCKKEGTNRINANAVLVDHFLWDYRRQHVEETDKHPFHKVRCVYY